ncbi:MAG: MFS transporter [Clostridia bacterium]|nr:MFS transporter [Clostridia bacterium]
MHKEKKRFSYEWVMVACCFLMVFTVLGFASTPRKLFMVAVPKALGIEYGPYSLMDTFRYITTAILNLFFGALVVKYGPRKLIAFGFAFLIGAMLVWASAENLTLIYLGGIMLGVGLTMASTTMASYVVNLWCRENKGTMTGLVLCANGLGGALAMQVLSPIINESVFSYRSAYRLTALILLAAGVLVVALFRNVPSGEAPVKAAKKQPKGADWEGITLREALAKPYFYIAAISIFLTGMVLQSIVGCDANHMSNAGLDSSTAASALSLSAIALTGSKFLVGFLYDRKGIRKTMLLCDIAALGTLLMLIGIRPTAAGKVMAYGYSIISAVALPLETIMIPLVTAELFGRKSYAQMLGIVSAINTAGFSLGPPITNFVFDAIGTYVPVFWVYLLVMAGITLAFGWALGSAQKDRISKKTVS